MVKSILSISDLHDEEIVLEKLNDWVKEVDLILIAGDITSNNLSYAEELKEIVGNKAFYIPGNNESEKVIEILNDINIHGRTITIDELKITGFGYSNKTPFNTPGDRDSIWWERELSKIEKQGDILITHVPPYGILDKTSKGLRVGCKELREFVDKSNYKLHVFGHVHENIGFCKKGEKIFVNLPPAFSGKGLLIENDELNIVDL